MVYIAGTNRTVDTGDTYFHEIANLPISGSVSAKHKLKRNNINQTETVGPPLDARIEHARFIVDCPYCNSAEFAFEDNLFLCSVCNNSGIDGKVRKVKMPKERNKIEDILSKRPIKNRHWFPGETVDDLQKENDKQGVK